MLFCFPHCTKYRRRDDYQMLNRRTLLGATAGLVAAASFAGDIPLGSNTAVAAVDPRLISLLNWLIAAYEPCICSPIVLPQRHSAVVLISIFRSCNKHIGLRITVFMGRGRCYSGPRLLGKHFRQAGGLGLRRHSRSSVSIRWAALLLG